jgi:N-acyl-D-aspartate/D-glutamate deacylase
MAHELVLRGGLIVDGSGSAPFEGDLAIDDGRITAVGQVDGRGHREFDARGHAVTPGFVDIHTHLDAQIGWDPACTPVSWHGVTTALLGNCGVSFAPCRPGDHALLAAMMETVEDIPRDAILGGLPWNWEDYGGYLDAVDALNPAVNIAGLIGHSALRCEHLKVLRAGAASDAPVHVGPRTVAIHVRLLHAELRLTDAEAKTLHLEVGRLRVRRRVRQRERCGSVGEGTGGEKGGVI